MVKIRLWTNIWSHKIDQKPVSATARTQSVGDSVSSMHCQPSKQADWPASLPSHRALCCHLPPECSKIKSGLIPLAVCARKGLPPVQFPPSPRERKGNVLSRAPVHICTLVTGVCKMRDTTKWAATLPQNYYKMCVNERWINSGKTVLSLFQSKQYSQESSKPLIRTWIATIIRCTFENSQRSKYLHP